MPLLHNYFGNVEVVFELCPNAKQVDEDFKLKVKNMYSELNLSLAELGQWGQIVAKWSKPAKHQLK
jgi:hypothetical protein